MLTVPRGPHRAAAPAPGRRRRGGTAGLRRAGAVLAAVGLGLAACGNPTEPGGLSGTLPGAGASSQEIAMQAWLAGFYEAHPGVVASYDPVGSGTGREMFLNGAVLFAGSDVPMDEEELARGRDRCFGGEVVELPLYISPIAVAYNLPGLGAEHLNLAPETLAAIFAGEITRWNDPAIAAANPGVALPDQAVVPVNRSDDSGTTESFTEYLAAAGGEAWPHEPSETWPISGTQSGTGTSGVVQTITAAEGTVGYIDAAQVTQDLSTVALGVGEDFVPFSAEAAAAVVDASPRAEDATDLRLTVELARDTDTPGTYPLVLVSYTLACERYGSEQDATNVRTLLEYMASPEGQERVARPDVAGAAPIGAGLREKVEAAIGQIRPA
ncbi:phosphate ABC transporter substrate-binding protein PstS [Georgenia sp. TF02-10]|uniref:phosphate ABC transporter substrate-binding protein PstS n=1 Tax=Georgenia sp. TF02-10 TaxID=2917725 RepID=UPI001FA6F69D|nr:phosphate ABC transporter substrate-binding protein PstS [Georgenia sp. TF02-10]UNX55318.1 phosphate ABC transporter substrate-binding protein PstS [Georgenia sp. TF02-10]